MKIQKYTNSKGKYLNKAFYKSINLNNRIYLLELLNILLLELLKKSYLQKLLKLQKIKLL
jgi:hypothetical protein